MVLLVIQTHVHRLTIVMKCRGTTSSAIVNMDSQGFFVTMKSMNVSKQAISARMVELALTILDTWNAFVPMDTLAGTAP